eukprot:scaffold27981_cov37-Cyclotella_meneghiniana.AAC.1
MLMVSMVGFDVIDGVDGLDGWLLTIEIDSIAFIGLINGFDVIRIEFENGSRINEDYEIGSNNFCRIAISTTSTDSDGIMFASVRNKQNKFLNNLSGCFIIRICQCTPMGRFTQVL